MAGENGSRRRTELAAERRLARTALAFRVDTDGATFVLRINRPGLHDVLTAASEMVWLRALASGAQLGVPEPVFALDGAAVVPVLDDRAREPRTAVLLRWQDGRFVDSGLTPRHLRQVAELQAGLQHHAASWDPPEAFVRPRVDTLTTAAKRRSIAPDDTTAGTWPAADDAVEAVTIVGGLLSPADAAIVSRGLDVVWATTTELATRPEAGGLIHGDLHYENFLFRHGAARAIDFDDCGWGFYLYDVAVTLWEREEREQYAQLRDAFLEEYGRHRPLPPNHDVHLRALFILRRIQMLMWIIESRRHSSFRDHWRASAEDEIGAITIALRRRSQ